MTDYDEYGNVLRYTSYENGEAIYDNIHALTCNEDGWYYEILVTSRFDTGEFFYKEYNQYGNVVRTYHTDENGNITADWIHEYLYEDGRKFWSKQYLFGKPTWEEYYHADDYLETDVEILEDGGTVVTTYNEEGDALRVITFAADGSVFSKE